MGTTISPWMERVFEILEDGPISRSELLAEVVGLVPPGRADRAWRKQRVWMAANRGYLQTGGHTAPVSDATIRAGARNLISQSLWTAIKKGRIKRYLDENGEVWYYKGRDRIVPTLEEKSRRARAANDAVSPEMRSERSRKAWQTYVERHGSVTRNTPAPTSAEVRSERGRKGWETRRQRYSPEEISAKQRHASLSRKRFGPRPRSEAAGGGTPPPAQSGQDGEAHGRPPVQPVASVDEGQARGGTSHHDSDRGMGQGEG